jgi:hypothetical protein
MVEENNVAPPCLGEAMRRVPSIISEFILQNFHGLGANTWFMQVSTKIPTDKLGKISYSSPWLFRSQPRIFDMRPQFPDPGQRFPGTKKSGGPTITRTPRKIDKKGLAGFYTSSQAGYPTPSLVGAGGPLPPDGRGLGTDFRALNNLVTFQIIPQSTVGF